MASEVDRQIEQRVLLLAPTQRDAEITSAFLSTAGLGYFVCRDLGEVCKEIGIGAGAVLLTEEVLRLPAIDELIRVLESQPAWSDLPLVMLMRGGIQSPESTRVLQLLRNVTLLERPATARSVISAVQAAVRARNRQYLARMQINEIRRGDARYREIRQQMEIAIDASELGTFHCEIPLDKIIWNDRCKAHFWLPPEAEINIDLFYSILHPDDRERTRKAVEECVYHGAPYDTEYRTVSPTGAIRWVRATGRTFFNENKQPMRFDGTTQDITDKRNAAEEREQLLLGEQAARAESERAGRMKDEFLATLSHELRTPLNAILGWSQLLGRDTGKETLKEGIEVIERNAKVQVQLIEDLLDMSRIISGKVRLDVKRIDPATFINAAFETVAPSAKAKGIQLHKVLDSKAGPIAGDGNRLQQVIWNLLSNAIKFTKKGGKVELLLERINSHIEVSVTDTGQGINPEFLPHVFERFRQADASTTRSHGGLGLGLAITRQLVELHGGTITATSPGVGMGSTFTIVLPIIVVNLMSSAEPRGQTRALQSHLFECNPTVLTGVTVLVVDDESDARIW